MLTPLIEKRQIEIVYEKWPIIGFRKPMPRSPAPLDGVDFDAVLAANDGLASGVIEALSEWRLAGGKSP